MNLNNKLNLIGNVNKREKAIDLLIYFCIFIVAAGVVWSLRNIALGTHDDINMFVDIQTHSLKEYLSLTFFNNIQRGRISPIQLLANVLLYGALSTKSQFLYSLVMYIPIISNVCFFAYIIGKRFGKYFGLFIPVFFFALVQVDNYHNLMVSYPLCFQLGLFMFLLGIQLFLEYFENKKFAYLIFSALCMFDSFSAYESFVCFYAVFFVIAFIININFEDKKIKWVSFFKQISIHTFFVVIYLAIYLICRHNSDLSYGGATIDTSTFSITLALKTLFTFSFSLFPLREFFSNFFNGSLSFEMITLRMIIKAIFVGLGSSITLYLSKDISKKLLFCLSLIGLIAAVVFCIPHSLTPQYQYWVSIGAAQGFVPSYISYFGIVLMLCSLIIFISNLKRLSKYKLIIVAIISIVMALGSLCTDISNQTTINQKTDATISYKLFDRLVKSEYYASLEDDAVIYTNTYTGIHNVISTLGEYGSIYCGKDYYFTNDINDVMQFDHKYYLEYDSENQCIVLSRMIQEGIVDSVYIMSYSDDNINCFYANKADTYEPVYMNKGYYSDYTSIIIIPVTDADNGILIQSENILLNSSKLTNKDRLLASELEQFSYGEIYSVNQDLPFLVFADGWAKKENWGRWSQGQESKLVIVVPKGSINSIEVRIEVIALKQINGLNVEIRCGDTTLTNSIIYENGTISFVVPNELINDNGIITLDVLCDNAVSPEDLGISIDSRVLGIGIENIQINLLN